MRIPRQIHDEILEHAREELPNECCGIVGGSGDEAATLYRARNAEPSPYHYTLDPQDLFRILHREIPERGEELFAMYHSHTKTPAYPSATDINLALYPEAVYLIASLAVGEEPLRGFRIEGGEVEEVDLEIV